MKGYKKTSPTSLKKKLNKEVVKFSFKKKDGSNRLSLGTRNLNLIPDSDRPSRIEDKTPKAIVYWDLNLKEFRSISSSTEVSVAAPGLVSTI